MRTTMVCGLLGAGKTTFIRSFVKGGVERTVVLVNDFGAAGIDGEVFAADGIESVELPSGCVCCTLKFDLITTVRRVVKQFSPHHLVIEPSGVASPSGVLEALESAGAGPASVVGIIDAVEFAELYESGIYGSFFQDQIVHSDVILVIKTDLAEEAAHFVAKNEYDCFDKIKTLLSYIPSNNTEEAPHVVTDDDPNRMDHNLINKIPENSLQPYDMKEIILAVVDNHQLFEVHELFAQNVIVGFARMNGRTVGIVANQPMYLAGALDIDSSNKASRFIRYCDAFNIPIITFVDTPGYMPGTNQEHNGIIRHGSKLLYAYCEATVPKITLVIGKAYGGAYIAMGSKNLRTDINYAWPTAQIAVLGSEAAVKIMNKKDLDNAKNPEDLKKQLTADFNEKFAKPYVAASNGSVDSVIDPAQTRPMLIKALEMLANKRDKQLPRKHGNINL